MLRNSSTAPIEGLRCIFHIIVNYSLVYPTESPSKRHKKHKKHKHKKKHDETLVEPAEEHVDVVQPAIKLKIKLGGQTIGNKRLVFISKLSQIQGDTSVKIIFKYKLQVEIKWPSDNVLIYQLFSLTSIAKETSEKPIVDKAQLLKAGKAVPTLVDGDVFKTKKKGDDTSDEEKEWLEALEAGELDDNGELSKKKDPTLLTARQVKYWHIDSYDSLRFCRIYSGIQNCIKYA